MTCRKRIATTYRMVLYPNSADLKVSTPLRSRAAGLRSVSPVHIVEARLFPATRKRWLSRPARITASIQIFGPACQILLRHYFVFLQRPGDLHQRGPAETDPVFNRCDLIR